MKKITLILLSLALLSTGCASSKMKESSVQQLEKPTMDEAHIVFIRASMFGGAIQSSLFEAKENDVHFIGILSAGKKVAYSVPPGKHTFMVVSEAADFMEANVEGGKTYYAMVTPRMGAWKARFSLFPVKNSESGDFQLHSSKFQGWLSSTELTENTEASRKWAEESKPSILKKKASYTKVWKTKSESEIAERTLNPEDGI